MTLISPAKTRLRNVFRRSFRAAGICSETSSIVIKLKDKGGKSPPAQCHHLAPNAILRVVDLVTSGTSRPMPYYHPISRLPSLSQVIVSAKLDDIADEKSDAAVEHQVLDVPAAAILQGELRGPKRTYRALKPRHLQLIGISGSIGTGLFLGTGGSLARAGPLGLLLGYAIYGGLVLITFNAVGEMVSYLPVDGSYLQFASRFVSPSFGFAMTWLATYNNAVTIAAEATAVASLIGFWNDSISPAVWCAIFIVSVFAINIFGVRYFGENEFWFSILKVFLIFGIFIFTFITMLGGNPQHDRFGFRYWKDPGPMAEHIATGPLGRFLGFWSVFVQAAFAYGGPDVLAMTAGEAMYPRRVLPSVFNRLIYRLLMFYIGGVMCAGILVPYNDPLLGTDQKGAGASPFVRAAVRLGIPVLPSIINAVIMTSAWSAGCSLTFVASRNLYTSALQGFAPKFFLKTYRGIPWVCLTAVVAVGCLCFLSLSNAALTVFTWITNVLGSMWLVNLCLMNIIYIRYRKGCAAMGIDRSKLPFKRRGQLFFSWLAVCVYPIIFLTNGFSVFTKGRWNIRDFLFAYIVLGVLFVLLVGHKVYCVIRYGHSWGLLRPEEMDFTTGKEEIDQDEKNYPPVGTSRKDRFLHWLWG